ncbi:unnamed protein product [Prunus armeniaca]|uniref:Knottins-like domain-containing protein n=1 Tax=Prunus armeniaca TaxID=36596 RepID=A0A6J5UK90_PRUAR|nr:unnamed protein product [Prunus armeniaca]
MVRQVGATECKYKSHLFKGMCFNKDKCYFICQSEAFERGQCEGIRRRCMCTKTCEPPPMQKSLLRMKLDGMAAAAVEVVEIREKRRT